MTHRFIAACRRQPVDRLPVWMMRQAGRYQPSYRAVRQKVGFLELCRSPELIAQVTIAPIDEIGFDAAILFSDILVHLPAMGLDLSFEKGEKGKGDGGPKIANPVRTRADVDALKVPEPKKDLPYVLDGVRAIRRPRRARAADRLRRRPVHGRELRGRGREPGVHAAQDDALRRAEGRPRALREAHPRRHRPDRGADRGRGRRRAGLRELARRAGPRGPRGVQLPLPRADRRGDPKAGVRSSSSPPGRPGTSRRWRRSASTCVSVDWRTPIQEVRARIPGVAVQGNFDSTMLFGPTEVAVERAPCMVQAAGDRARLHLQPRPRHPARDRPRRNVKAVVEAVQAFSWK